LDFGILLIEEKKEEGVVVLVLKMIVEYQLKKYH